MLLVFHPFPACQKLASHKSTKTTKQTLEEEADRVLERGHIYFFYRPKVDVTTATCPDEVQHFYFILKPHARLNYDSDKLEDSTQLKNR